MPPGSPENKSRPEKEQPVNMNNFHLYLPDGYNRQRGRAENTPEQIEIMDAIDRLLATEFSHLDAARIYKTMLEPNRAITDGVNSGRYKSSAELQKAVKPKEEAARLAREELRPLFNRLVEMGFDPETLGQ